VLAVGSAAIGFPNIVSRAEETTMRCGVVTSLSGAYMMGGNLTRRGYDLFAEEINKQGGLEIGGQRYPVKLIYGDAQSTPSSGASAAERLIVQEEVDMLFGPYSSGVTLAVQPLTTKYAMPMISGSAESTKIWLKKPPFNFGINPSVDLTAANAIQALVGTASAPKPQTAAVVGVNVPFSKETAQGFKQGVEESALVLEDFELVPRDADMTPIVSRLADIQPDVVAVGAHEEALINLVKAMKGMNFWPKALIMHYGVTNPSFIEAMGEDAEGVLGISNWVPQVPYEDSLFGTAKDYDELSFARWGSHPDYGEVACSASGVVLMDAVKRLGKAPPYSRNDRVALAEALEATDMETVYGPVKFESSGDHFHCNTKPQPMLMQIQDGAAKPIAPSSAAQALMRYPLAG